MQSQVKSFVNRGEEIATIVSRGPQPLRLAQTITKEVLLFGEMR